MEEVLETIPTRVTEGMNNMLNMAYSDVEIYKALKMMGLTKSLGPDSLNARFFQHYWDIVGGDVAFLINEILSSLGIPPKLNHTNVVLVLTSKVSKPMKLIEFRPISLCNVIYKLSTKVNINKLKKLLP